MMKFDAGIGGTFSGAPGSEARPAEMSHDSSVIPDECLSIVAILPDNGNGAVQRLDRARTSATARAAPPNRSRL